MEKVVKSPKKGFFNRFLDFVERAGNKLPHPFTMFVYLCLIVMAVSLVLSLVGVSVVHPGTGKDVAVRNLISKDGLVWMLGSMLSNFTGFAPLGLVLVMTLGIGLAEEAGLIFTFLRRVMLGVPARFITVAVIIAGILGNIASDAAFVVIPPLAAIIFLSVKRHPLAGLAAGFAGVGAGFTANLMIAGTDALLAGITNEAAKMVNESIKITEVSNWYFLIASTFILTVVGAWVTEKIIEPRLGKYEGGIEKELEEVTPIEKKGLRNAGIAALVYIGIVLVTVVPTNGILRGENGAVLRSPFMSSIIPILFLFFVTMAVAYGKTVGTIQSEKDIPKMMAKSMKGMAGYIVLVFAASQFIAYFNWTNIGTVIAVKGADFLDGVGFTGIPLIIGFIIISTFVNLFIGSGSAKWALLAPIFVPMLMILNYSPAFVQLAYRIGDSATNPMTPLFPYFPIILAYAQEYKKDAGVGTILSLMIPFSLIFLGTWIVQLILWSLLNLPLGPGAGIFL